MKTGFSFVINSKLLASVDPNNWKDLPHYRTGHLLQCPVASVDPNNWKDLHIVAMSSCPC